MDNIDQKRVELDEVLKSAGPNVGIAFGTELYDEFRRRGWFTLEKFTVLGTENYFADLVPAYSKSHWVFPSWGIPELDFRVGKNQ